MLLAALDLLQTHSSRKDSKISLGWTFVRQCWKLRKLKVTLKITKTWKDLVSQGNYKELIESSFGAEVPESLGGRQFDCVVMKGGFAAGHLPLTR